MHTPIRRELLAPPNGIIMKFLKAAHVAIVSQSTAKEIGKHTTFSWFRFFIII
jgi:hypothetical protein